MTTCTPGEPHLAEDYFSEGQEKQSSIRLTLLLWIMFAVKKVGIIFLLNFSSKRAVKHALQGAVFNLPPSGTQKRGCTSGFAHDRVLKSLSAGGEKRDRPLCRSQTCLDIDGWQTSKWRLLEQKK